MKVKEKSEEFGLKLNIQKTKIMASGPITSWQVDGKTIEIVTDFIFLGSKITADGDCSHEIKKTLAPWKKSYDQPSGGGGEVAKSCPTLANPWIVACQAPLSLGFSRQEYWSGLLFPSPGDLPIPGIGSPALQADSLPT